MSFSTILVVLVVLGVVALQYHFFHENHKRMEEFRDIFSEKTRSSLQIDHDLEDFVSGISGKGNQVFQNIKGSINEYLASNKGSVIDFHLIKDAIDRHYDAVDEDINAQMPVPLYCGLAGTMLGVIIGLASLLFANGLTTMMGGSERGATSEGQTVVVADSRIMEGEPTKVTVKQVDARQNYVVSYDDKDQPSGLQHLSATEMQQAKATASSIVAAEGINDLLRGVAWAMVASVFGIFLTTRNSLKFKKFKLEAERGKNIFLSWLQSTLLPELPGDTGEAMGKLVVGLNKFNNTFTQNVSTLSQTFDKVNDSYRTQAEIIERIHDMDMQSMAEANVKVLHELQQSTAKLQQFNSYLDKMNAFNLQFSQQADTQQIFQKIADYFNHSKAYIQDDVDQADAVLNRALHNLNDSTIDHINHLQAHIEEMTDRLRNMIAGEQEAFDHLSHSLRTQFDENMRAMPSIAERMEQLADLPRKLDRFVTTLTESQYQLADTIAKRQLADGEAQSQIAASKKSKKSSAHGGRMLRLVAMICLVIITACCLFGTYAVWSRSTPADTTTADSILRSLTPKSAANINQQKSITVPTGQPALDNPTTNDKKQR